MKRKWSPQVRLKSSAFTLVASEGAGGWVERLQILRELEARFMLLMVPAEMSIDSQSGLAAVESQAAVERVAAGVLGSGNEPP